MDNSRTLPPLVRGKLTDNFDIIAQVQWWGEISPVSIRPKILHLPNKVNSSTHAFNASVHSAHYEIKTTMDLLKSYLNACEVLELSVYETVENYVIGSGFLKNLTYLLNRNNEIIFIPVIDYLGEEIGQIKMHTYFFEYPKDNKKHSDIYTTKKNIDLGRIGRKVRGFSGNDYIFPAEKTIFYDGYSRVADFEIESDSECSISDNKYNFAASNFEGVGLNSCLMNQAKEKFVNFPEVCVSKDTSKVLNFDVGLKNNQKPEKNNELKLATKFSSESIKCKSKAKTEKSNLGVSTGKLSKRIPSTNHLTKPVKKAVNQNVKPVKLPNESNKSLNLENNFDIDSNKRVFDYLFGSSMSRENEEVALKEFTKMSPSHDIVSSINKLCLTPDKSSICDNLKLNLQFDLTNPIERNYYEMFFVKNNTHDFEIAELLNEPRSRSVEDCKNINKDYVDNVNKISIEKALSQTCDNLLDKDRVDSFPNACARCKYYKKLDELDTIIESLKYFEKNMLKQEKELDFEGGLNKQQYKMSNR